MYLLKASRFHFFSCSFLNFAVNINVFSFVQCCRFNFLLVSSKIYKTKFFVDVQS